jgi:TctA family transporter
MAATLGWLSIWIGIIALQEFAALVVLLLSGAIALARLSRLRAAAMLLLGILVAAVGVDWITGQPRLTMGVEQLFDGLDRSVLALGLIVVADGLIGIVSPTLLPATYTRRISGWSDPNISTPVALGVRVVAAIAIAGSCYLAFVLVRQILDVGLLLLFGLFGVACKIFGWNRLMLLLGASCSMMLEQFIVETLREWGASPTKAAVAVQSEFGVLSPLSAILLAAAGAVLVAVFALFLRRGLTRNAVGPARA